MDHRRAYRQILKWDMQINDFALVYLFFVCTSEHWAECMHCGRGQHIEHKTLQRYQKWREQSQMSVLVRHLKSMAADDQIDSLRLEAQVLFNQFDLDCNGFIEK